jgi:hypothetical protein
MPSIACSACRVEDFTCKALVYVVMSLRSLPSRESAIRAMCAWKVACAVFVSVFWAHNTACAVAVWLLALAAVEVACTTRSKTSSME